MVCEINPNKEKCTEETKKFIHDMNTCMDYNTIINYDAITKTKKFIHDMNTCMDYNTIKEYFDVPFKKLRETQRDRCYNNANSSRSKAANIKCMEVFLFREIPRFADECKKNTASFNHKKCKNIIINYHKDTSITVRFAHFTS